MRPCRIALARWLAVALAAVLAVLGTGCGSEKPTTARRFSPGRNVDPVAHEGMGAVTARVQGAATATSCMAVKGLMHSIYGTISDAACASVRAELGAFRNPRGQTYGTGAVIEYSAGGDRRKVMALALDADRRFHVAFIEDARGSAIGTPPPAESNADASTVVRAMRSGDCDTFLRYVDRSIGLGTGSDELVCRRVSSEPVRRELQDYRAAHPVAMGGNAKLAFYKLRTSPTRYYTMIMVRDEAVRPSSVHLLVNAFPA